jgi:hypothetical protein
MNDPIEIGKKASTQFCPSGRKLANGKEIRQSQGDYSRQRQVFPACGEEAGWLLQAWRGEIRPHSFL